eukprot:Selendium_serpulae@DN3882_c0_g1_i3.p1
MDRRFNEFVQQLQHRLREMRASAESSQRRHRGAPQVKDDLFSVVRDDMNRLRGLVKEGTRNLKQRSQLLAGGGRSYGMRLQRQVSGSAFPATAYIMGANLIVFLMWKSARPELRNIQTNQAPGLINYEFMRRHFVTDMGNWRVHTLLTYQFSHNELMHFVINMAMVYMYGSFLEPITGSKDLARLYLSCGVAGGVANSLWGSNPCLGASASACGMMAMAAVLYPRLPVYIFGIIPMPSYLAVLLFLLYSAENSKSRRDRVAHGGHLGGLLAGIALGYRYKRFGRLF